MIATNRILFNRSSLARSRSHVHATLRVLTHVNIIRQIMRDIPEGCALNSHTRREESYPLIVGAVWTTSGGLVFDIENIAFATRGICLCANLRNGLSGCVAQLARVWRNDMHPPPCSAPRL